MDRTIIKAKYGHCINLHQNKINANSIPPGFENILYFKNQVKCCHQLHAQYPEYNLKSFTLHPKVSANSYLGQLINDINFLRGKIEKDLNAVKKALNTANPNLLIDYWQLVLQLISPV